MTKKTSEIKKTIKPPQSDYKGILAINKPRGITSFSLVRMLRKQLNVQKIGHAGTLDPFADGVMVMLVGRDYTRLSDSFLHADKEYVGTIHLGIATDTYDCDGESTFESPLIPSQDDLERIISEFQGKIMQTPPMYSAKKINGVKLYDLARNGVTVEREPVEVTVETKLMSYNYPHAIISVKCSKGTYIRSIAHEIGERLGCGGHLSSLTRTRSGTYNLADCVDEKQFTSPEELIKNLRHQQ
jgi:tRNA pseudouridine55 synthase